MHYVSKAALAAVLGVTVASADAAVVLEPVDTIFVPARSITVTGKQSADLVGLIYSRENLYFNDPGAPRFLFFDKEGKIAFGVGGAVRGTAHYDFDGSINDGPDFTTFDIPIPANPARRQALGADASNSSIFMKLVGRTTRFGYYSAYIQTKFTGSDGGYGLALKQAYLTLGPFTAGLTNSTFSDNKAGVPTIDEAGPSGATTGKNIQFRYSPRIDSHLSAGVAVEFSKMTMEDRAGVIGDASQRVPDIPAYIQYRWHGGASHVRLSAIVRSLSYYDLIQNKNRMQTGWGAQLSGYVALPAWLTVYYQALYGAGIARYVNDLSGQDLDLIPDGNTGRAIAPKTLGLVGGLQFSKGNFLASASWSLCRLYNQSATGDYATTFRRASYVTANAFYTMYSDLQLGIEYNWGLRRNMNGDHNNANRISLLVQYSF